MLEKVSGYQYSSTQINLPQDLAEKVKSWGRKFVSEKDLYVDKEDNISGFDDSPHITVKYGIHTSNVEEVKKTLSHQGPIRFKLGKISKFTTNPKFDVLKIEVDSPDLHDLNKQISNGVECTDTHPTYNPHVTIAYIKKGTGPTESLDYFQGMPGEVGSIEFSPKDGDKQVLVMEKTAMNKLAELFVQDVETAVAEKLAAAIQRRKKSRKKKLDIERYAKDAGGVAATAFTASVMSDLKTKPVEFAKEKLYGAVDSAASLIIKRKLW